MLHEEHLVEVYGTGTTGWLDMRLNLADILNNHSSPLCVISYGDWGWALGLRQLGAQCVRCLPATNVAAALLGSLGEWVPGLTVVSALPPTPGTVVAHLPRVGCLHSLKWLVPETMARVLISCPASMMGSIVRAMGLCEEEVEGRFNFKRRWRRCSLTHKELGGLTALKVGFVWTDGDRTVGNGMTVEPIALPDIITQCRDPVRVLEPAARLSQWVDPKKLKTLCD